MNLERIVSGLVVLGLLGFIGALPATLIASLFFGGSIGWEILLLFATVIALWLPQKIRMDMQVKGETRLHQIIPARFNPAMLQVIMFLAIPLTPILWMFTGSALLIGLMVYIVSEQTLWLALLAALAVQEFNIYRQARREKETGAGGFFTQWQNMQSNFNIQTISIDAEGNVQRQSYSSQASGEDEAEAVRYLAADNDEPDIRLDMPDETVIEFDDDQPDVITLDTDEAADSTTEETDDRTR